MNAARRSVGGRESERVNLEIAVFIGELLGRRQIDERSHFTVSFTYAEYSFL
jgi:hypothetical protein